MQYLIIIYISTKNYLEHPAGSCKKKTAPVGRTPGMKFHSSAGNRHISEGEVAMDPGFALEVRFTTSTRAYQARGSSLVWCARYEQVTSFLLSVYFGKFIVIYPCYITFRLQIKLYAR